MPQSLYRSEGRHATWLELFFDLVFVAVFGVVAHDLAHTHNGHIGLEQLLRFPLVFIPVWWIWMTHTLYANRFDTDSREHRLFSLLIMGIMVLLSTLAADSLGSSFTLFVALYVLMRWMLAYRYWREFIGSQKSLGFARDLTLAIFVGGLVSLSAVALEGLAKYVVFYLGMAVDVIWQVAVRGKVATCPVDREHLVERIGLLAIIILGESIIAMVASLDHEEWNLMDMVSAGTGFLLIGAIWWIYFDSFPKLEQAKRLKTANALIYPQLLLCMGLLILANMIRHAILGDLDRPTFGLLAVTGLLLFYLGKQIPYWYAFPPWRRVIITNSLICVAITVASSWLPRIEYSMLGMTLGIFVYVYLGFRRVMTVDVSDYLEKQHEPEVDENSRETGKASY